MGAVLGALLAYLVVTAPPTSLMRRAVTAVCGVLAQFGGVTLAFAWIATLGFGGLLTGLLADTLGADPNGAAWLYDLPGLILVYTYFQIPLMVIVFLPALEGLRPQWREAAVNLGATTRQYWTQVAFPLLRPAFLGSLLLLFANAFAAYATAAALVTVLAVARMPSATRLSWVVVAIGAAIATRAITRFEPGSPKRMRLRLRTSSSVTRSAWPCAGVRRSPDHPSEVRATRCDRRGTPPLSGGSAQSDAEGQSLGQPGRQPGGRHRGAVRRHLRAIDRDHPNVHQPRLLTSRDVRIVQLE